MKIIKQIRRTISDLLDKRKTSDKYTISEVGLVPTLNSFNVDTRLTMRLVNEDIICKRL